MEQLLTKAFESGNITAIALSICVYILIAIQRKETGTKRDKTNEDLKLKINELQLRIENAEKRIDITDVTLNEIKTSIQNIEKCIERLSTTVQLLIDDKIKKGNE